MLYWPEPADDQTVAEYDEKLQALDAELGGLSYRLGHAVQPFLQRGHDKLGYSRFAPFASDLLGVSGRTLQRDNRLARGLDKYALLRFAFEAGRLGKCQCLLLLSELDRHPEREAELVAEALTLTVRELQESLKQDGDGRPERLVRYYEVSPDIADKFADIHESMCREFGAQISTGETAELMAAEFLSGAPIVPDPSEMLEVAELPERQARGESRRDRREKRAEERNDGWKGLPPRPRVVLEKDELPTDPRALLELVRSLLRRSGEIEREMDRLLAHLGPNLMFDSAEHYASERLGMGRTALRERRNRRLACQRFSVLAEALEEERLQPGQADLLLGLLKLGVNESAYVEWAEQVTCHSIREWVRTLRELHSRDSGEFAAWVHNPPGPHERAHRVARSTRRRLRDRSRDAGLEGLGDFMKGYAPAPQPLDDLVEASVLALMGPARAGLRSLEVLNPPIRMLSSSTRPVLLMVSLSREAMTVLLMGELAAGLCLSTWSTREEEFARLVEAFLAGETFRLVGQVKRLVGRDGACCQVPGCGSRHNLQSHHVVFRSQGGGDEDSNRVLVCAACHLRLIHAGYLKLTGRAPDGLLWERLTERFLGEYRVTV